MNTEKDEVQVAVAIQGDAVVGKEGYMALRGEAVVAFYLDAWGDKGRAYPLSSSSCIFMDGELKNYPSIALEDGDDDSKISEIYFPEFEGWNVHSISGGKTLSICLVKRN